MLETDDVDDDFFTPVAGTSLANIFGSNRNKEETVNDSLKYVPPKPETIPKKTEQPKATECVLACALIGNEWCNNVYISRGKLGFAIVKIQKTGDHNIILYDSNKTTLSSTCITTSFTVTIKNNTYLSYYDSLQKYWSIYGTVEEIKKISEVLENLQVNVSYSSYLDKGPPEPNKTEMKENILLKESLQSKESDTDSSVNIKTKASILNRMANMGHSVLPTRGQATEDSSESSDTPEIDVQPKLIRHKPVKPSKRNTAETLTSESHYLTESQQRIIAAKTEPENNLAVYNSQQLPIANSSIIANTGNEFGIYMSEQRISNSELRININRITDKVDTVLSKINDLEYKGKNTDVSKDILLKLLAEYENKIKVYEEMLKSNSNDVTNIERKSLSPNKDKQIEILSNKLSEIIMENEAKCSRVSELENEVKALKDKHIRALEDQARKESELNIKINSLEAELKMKIKEISDLNKNITTESTSSSNNIHNKLKNIMNDTFQTISMNFENNETYTAEVVKRIVGTVIKKNTIDALSEL